MSSLNDAVANLSKAFGELANAVIQVWNEIKELLADVEYIEIPRRNWNVPMKIAMRSQVMNRKPILSLARSNC